MTCGECSENCAGRERVAATDSIARSMMRPSLIILTVPALISWASVCRLISSTLRPSPLEKKSLSMLSIFEANAQRSRSPDVPLNSIQEFSGSLSICAKVGSSLFSGGISLRPRVESIALLVIDS